MLDDLRNSSTFIEEDQPAETAIRRRPSRRRRNDTFLGMTAVQRFILSLMLFLLICVLGAFALLFSGSIVLPF